MNEASAMLLFGQSLYAVAALTRFVRLYASLGMSRPPSAAWLLAVHCLGMTLGYFFGILWYEFAIVLFFALLKRDALIAAGIALVVIRGLDASCLLCLSLFAASYENMRWLLLYMGVLLLGIAFFFISLTSVIRRIEKKVLAFPHPVAGILPLLQCLHTLRRQITLLAWQRRGSLSVFIVLTLGGWFLEWLAFYCLLPTGEEALVGMLRRVMEGGRATGASALDALQPGVWGLGALAAAMPLARLVKMRALRRTHI